MSPVSGDRAIYVGPTTLVLIGICGQIQTFYGEICLHDFCLGLRKTTKCLLMYI